MKELTVQMYLHSYSYFVCAVNNIPAGALAMMQNRASVGTLNNLCKTT